jgi:16S rRNA (cytosine1402-N4)-methyltransferase
MPEVVARELITDREGIYLDATFGGGGHAEVILANLERAGRVIGLDRDPEAVRQADGLPDGTRDRLSVIHADYRDLAQVLEREGIRQISGALFDLGLSSLQLDESERGFAYRLEGPLDLRFDRSRGPTAADWLHAASEKEIANALHTYGEERYARRIAKLVVAQRGEKPITATGQLVDLLRRVVGAAGRDLGRTSARVFQALRIVVNDELAAIPVGVESALNMLVPGGRLVVIAYHSLEDRLVKSLFREAARECRCPKVLGRCVCDANPRGRIVHRRVIRASDDEVRRNPRAKAARLRVFERDPAAGHGGDR